MRPQTPTVEEYMTPMPATVNVGLTLSDATDRMFSDNIRHLVVVDDQEELVGILSSRDVALATSVRGVDPRQATVGDAMTRSVLTCSRDAPIDAVTFQMEKHRIGSAIVSEGGKPIGVFTTIDVMRALRSFIAGTTVDGAVHPSHVVTPPAERQPTVRRHPAAPRPSPYDGTLSWFCHLS